jgi:SSS family solute:Na+ symporter
MLGVFLLAFYVKSVNGTAAFIGAIIGELAVLSCFQFTSIAWLWYNVIGRVVVVVTGLLLSVLLNDRASTDIEPVKKT